MWVFLWEKWEPVWESGGGAWGCLEPGLGGGCVGAWSQGRGGTWSTGMGEPYWWAVGVLGARDWGRLGVPGGARNGWCLGVPGARNGEVLSAKDGWGALGVPVGGAPCQELGGTRVGV